MDLWLDFLHKGVGIEHVYGKDRKAVRALQEKEYKHSKSGKIPISWLAFISKWYSVPTYYISVGQRPVPRRTPALAIKNTFIVEPSRPVWLDKDHGYINGSVQQMDFLARHKYIKQSKFEFKKETYRRIIDYLHTHGYGPHSPAVDALMGTVILHPNEKNAGDSNNPVAAVRFYRDMEYECCGACKHTGSLVFVKAYKTCRYEMKKVKTYPWSYVHSIFKAEDLDFMDNKFLWTPSKERVGSYESRQRILESLRKIEYTVPIPIIGDLYEEGNQSKDRSSAEEVGISSRVHKGLTGSISIPYRIKQSVYN